MFELSTQPLKVFLCYASEDKPLARKLYRDLIARGIDVWLDEEKLLPGQDWDSEIRRAVRNTDAIVVCLSQKSVRKEGYVNKEITFALNIVDEKPEGTIFLIPARLDDCLVPTKLTRWHWVDLFTVSGYDKFLKALITRALSRNKSELSGDMYAKESPLSMLPRITKQVDYDSKDAEFVKSTESFTTVQNISFNQKKELIEETHRIAILILGGLSGFLGVLLLRALSDDYNSQNDLSLLSLITDLIANSDFLFLIMVLIGVIVGAVVIYFLDQYYGKRDIPLWFRYPSSLVVGFVVGILGNIASCILLPIGFFALMTWLESKSK